MVAQWHTEEGVRPSDIVCRAVLLLNGQQLQAATVTLSWSTVRHQQ
jgi:hypothetical protein